MKICKLCNYVTMKLYKYKNMQLSNHAYNIITQLCNSANDSIMQLCNFANNTNIIINKSCEFASI